MRYKIVTVQQAEEAKLPRLAESVSKAAFWLSVALFLKALADAV